MNSKLMKDLKVRLTDRAMNKFAIMKDGRMELHIGEMQRGPPFLYKYV